MIFDQLSLNIVEELKTSLPGELADLAAILVEATFTTNNRRGLDIPHFRKELRKEAVERLYENYISFGFGKEYYNLKVIEGYETTSAGERVKLERVEFINGGEEDCEEVRFRKVFFIPVREIIDPDEGPEVDAVDPETGKVDDSGGGEAAEPTPLETGDTLTICNYKNFRTKVRFIENFMKMNFFALQRPATRKIVKGINFRKFALKKKKLSGFLNTLDGIIEKSPNALDENIIIYFSAGTYDTVAKIEYQKESNNKRRTAFVQSKEDYEARRYKNFNDRRANYYINSFDSIYPRVFGGTFRGGIDFLRLVRDNFQAPGVSVEENDCLANVSRGVDGSGAAIGRVLTQATTDPVLKEVRTALEKGPVKTLESLTEETRIFSSNNVLHTFKKELKQIKLEEGRTLSKEMKQFLANLDGFNAEKELKDLAAFAGRIDWDQIFAIALSSIASRYGINGVLDEEFTKKLIVERISKTFNDEKTLRIILDTITLEQLQAAAIFLQIATIDYGVKKRTKPEENKEIKKNLTENEPEPSLEALEEQLGSERATREERRSQRRIERETQRVEEVRQRLENSITELEEARRYYDEFSSVGEAADNRRTGPSISELSTRVATAEAELLRREDNLVELAVKDDIDAAAEIYDRRLEAVERDIAMATSASRGAEPGSPRAEAISQELQELYTQRTEIVAIQLSIGLARERQAIIRANEEPTDQRKKFLRAVERSRIGISATDAREGIIDAILEMTNCDRQNSATLLKELVEYVVLGLGAPVLDYFEEWSSFINAWDVKNLDFCNLPKLNVPKIDFKNLFPLNIQLPRLPVFDLLKLLLDLLVKTILALILALVKALIKFLISLIPDVVFELEPCEIVNALRDFSGALSSAICNGMNSDGPFPIAERIAMEGCRLLPNGLENGRDSELAIDFVKDSCNGILPGPDLADLLSGEVSDTTADRARVYLEARGASPEFIAELKKDPEILSGIGATIGDIIGFGDIVGALENFQPLLPSTPFELCADPELDTILTGLCANDDPVLREQLLEILENQRKLDAADAQKVFGYLSDPGTLSREIESMLPTMAHPSIFVPPYMKKQREKIGYVFQENVNLAEDIPFVQDKAKFSLGRDQGDMLKMNQQAIEANLQVMNTPISTYASGLVEAGRDYRQRIQDSSSTGLIPLGGAPITLIKEPESVGEINLDDLRARVWNQRLYGALPQDVLALMRREEIVPEVDETFYYRVASNFYRKRVFERVDRNYLSGGALSAITNGPNPTAKYTPAAFLNGLIRNTISSYVTPDAIDFTELSSIMKNDGLAMAMNVTRKSIDTSARTSDDAIIPSARKDEIMAEYINGSFAANKSYKRFVQSSPRFSKFFLDKTDAELVSLKETLNAAIISIALEQAHMIQAIRTDVSKGQIFVVNDLVVNTINKSRISLRIKERLDEILQQLEVLVYDDVVTTGSRAFSFFLYELARVTGDLEKYDAVLKRETLPTDVLNIEIQNAINRINEAYDDTEIADRRTKASFIFESASTTRSALIPFRMPAASSMNINRDKVQQLFEKWDSDTTSSKSTFLTSTTSFRLSPSANSVIHSRLTEIDFSTIAPENAEKAQLFTLVLNRLIEGRGVHVSYEELFPGNRRSLIKSFYQIVNRELELNKSYRQFLKENFTIDLMYRVFSSYLFEQVEEGDVEARNRLLDGERRSVGLYAGRKVNLVFNTSPGQPGTAFSFVELASFKKEAIDFEFIEKNGLNKAENRDRFITNYYVASSETGLAAEVSQDVELKMLFAYVAPIANIINETTSYSIDAIKGALTTNVLDIRPLVFSDITSQNEVCALILRRLLASG